MGEKLDLNCVFCGDMNRLKLKHDKEKLELKEKFKQRNKETNKKGK